MLCAVYASKKYVYFNADVESDIVVVKYYMIWIGLEFIRAAFIANIYWEWKFLVNNFLTFALTILIYFGTNKIFIQNLFAFWVKYIIWIFLPFLLIFFSYTYGVIILPITFLMLFISAIPAKRKMILLLFIAVFVFTAFDERTNVIKCVVAIFLGYNIYHFRYIIPQRVLRGAHRLMIIAPVVLFILAVTGVFNVFKIDEYIVGDYSVEKRNENGDLEEKKLTFDSRSLLYLEVLQSTYRYNSWILGRSPALGNDSQAFGAESLRLYGRSERLGGNEVGVLDIFNWFGLIGLLLYIMVFYNAGNLAINKSKNIYCKIVGLYVAFLWIWSWVWEKPMFREYYALDLLMIGLCFSKSFRVMSNDEVKFWVRGIFDYRYRINNNKYAGTINES